MNVPNILTVFRIFLTPLFIYLLFNDFLFSNFFALLVFVLASITDAYDGYYARKYNVETEIGNFLNIGESFGESPTYIHSSIFTFQLSRIFKAIRSLQFRHRCNVGWF